MNLYLILFLAGLLTILLPCILPLIPIVLGVSIAGRSKLRPLMAVAGMVVSFVGFTFLLLVVLKQFVEVADYMRIGTYYVLLLFGLGFTFHKKWILYTGALLGGLFFLSKGIPSALIAAVVGAIAMQVGGRVATIIQQFGTNVQSKARDKLGKDNPLTAFVMGLTMGLVWVPCAGPALGFAFTLVREQPGLTALSYLLVYGLGTAVPLLLIGYGGQAAVHSVRALSRYSGKIKQVAGVILILTALAFQLEWFRSIEIWLINNTSFGNLGVDIEQRLFSEDMDQATNNSTQPNNMELPTLPKISRAPEFTGLGPWHNSSPFTLEELKGKVVLVDFWTYSCINCIRTLPYIQGYHDKFKDKPFVLLGVHTPEFVFEKSEQNVAKAIDFHKLTYPVAQDNDFGTWKAFANRYWPAKYLIDAEGYVRYTHFGEGDYDETDLAIQSLLNEIGVEVDGQAIEYQATGRRNQSPETYLGSRSWPSLGNKLGEPTEEIIEYSLSKANKLHSYELEGKWQLVDDEKQVLRDTAGKIRMKFLGGEINLVMGYEGLDPTKSFAPTVEVSVDGEPSGMLTINRYDLYQLWQGNYGEHTIELSITGQGTEGYAFTFGS